MRRGHAGQCGQSEWQYAGLQMLDSCSSLLDVLFAFRARGLAYQGYANWAWSVLRVSALLELVGITAFAMNTFGTFTPEPSYLQKQPLVVGIN